MIIGIENQGVHNQDLNQASQRVIEGGSWKQQRVVMMIPASKLIHAKVYLSHCSLIFPPNQPCYKMVAIGMEVGEAFSSAITEVITHSELGKWEYLLTIEHDNLPPSDGLIKLLKRMEDNPQYSWISGLYWTKGEGGQPQIWGDPKAVDQPNFRPQPPDVNGGLVECCGTGMGFALWRLQMFKDERLRRPWFKTVAGQEGVGTQDLYFASDARKYGYKCAVDCGVKVGHMDLQTEMIW